MMTQCLDTVRPFITFVCALHACKCLGICELNDDLMLKEILKENILSYVYLSRSVLY